MDRIQFINSINHKNKQLSDFIFKYIDQYMLLYQLVDRRDKIQYIGDNRINSITFQIVSNPNAITALSKNISTAPNIKEYEKVVHIDFMLVSSNIINLTLTLV